MVKKLYIAYGRFQQSRLLFRLQSARCPIVSQSHLAAGHSELVGGYCLYMG